MAGEDDIKVDIDAVSDERKGIKAQTENELDASMTNMRTSVEALADMWEGPNHDQFIATFKERFSGLETFNKMLTTYHKALQRAWMAYSECEDNIKQYIV